MTRARGLQTPGKPTIGLVGGIGSGKSTVAARLREVFEEHWEHVIFGPCIEGAVFEGNYRAFREEFLSRYHSGEALAPI